MEFRSTTAPGEIIYNFMTSQTEETQAARIARILADRIISGLIEPGARLRQDHIAEEFGASHVPVREAFRHLESQGLAKSLPRRGVRVTTFDMAELREVAEMRAALEALALRHAAPHLTRTIFEQAEEATRAADQATNVRDWEAANRRFHRTILAPCDMPRLMKTIDDLHAASARFLFAAWRSDWETRTDHEHRSILNTLKKGQIDTACTTLARHVSWIGRRPVRTKNGDIREAYAISG